MPHLPTRPTVVKHHLHAVDGHGADGAVGDVFVAHPVGGTSARPDELCTHRTNATGLKK